MTQGLEVPAVPIAERGSDSGPAVQDHLLLIIKGMVNDTSVSMLVDSGARGGHTRVPSGPLSPVRKT